MSKCTTQPTSSTWMPRAATSVATKAWAFPLWKAASARSRCAWLRSPWMGTADTPSLVNCLATLSAPRLHPEPRQLLGDLVGAPLGPTEDHGRPVLDDEVACQLHALLAHGVDEVVGRAVVLGLRRRDLAPDGVALVVAHQDIDGAVERR